MFLTPVQTMIMILAVALGTMITRFTPFFVISRFQGTAEDRAVSWKGSATGNDGVSCGLLPEKCITDKITSRDTGTDCHCSDHCFT